MSKFSSNRNVVHSAQQMFDLVADVETYPQFISFCDKLEIEERKQEGGNEVIIARMHIGYKAFTESFLSSVLLNRKDMEIEVRHIDGPHISGPMSHLLNCWKFQEREQGGCCVDFYLEYEMRNFAMQLLIGSVVDAGFAKFAESFEIRADQIYA